MLMLSIGNAYFMVQGSAINIGDSYFAWLIVLGFLFGVLGWLCFGFKKPS